MEITKENIKQLVGRRFKPNVKQDWEGKFVRINGDDLVIKYSDERAETDVSIKTVLNTIKNGDWILLPKEYIQPHYNNTNGSLYLFAHQHGLNAWEFDCLKRVVRCRKKGEFESDIKKTIAVLELYLKEYEIEKH